MELDKLQKYRNRNDMRLDELVDIANEFIGEVAPEQPSDRVTEILNERTFRYYTAQGLVDRPLGREGTSSLYGYRHLLQILVVKHLQSSYFPIKRIREIIAGEKNEVLELILKIPPKEPEEPVIHTGRRLREHFEEGEKQKRLGSSRQATSSNTGPQTGSSWKRFTLVDGIELHIRSDRKGSIETSKIKRMVGRVLNSVKSK